MRENMRKVRKKVCEEKEKVRDFAHRTAKSGDLAEQQ